MTNKKESTEGDVVAYLRRTAADLKRSRNRIRELEARLAGPIAVVGMSCRFPGGVRSADDLWGLVDNQVDAITPFPTDRGWDLDGLFHPDPDHLGTSIASEGGFIDGVTDFDAGFFGIGPREAVTIDPHQRLLLELTWELLESAGIDPESQRGTDTGVFAGSIYHDYAIANGCPPELEQYLVAGNPSSLVSGRVSYSFGFEGPSITVDTACSSSLVAMHLACQALRAADCSLAVAGGITIFSTTGIFLGFSRLRGLSTDGRCRSFSSTASGTSCAEGAGLLLLERLADAERNGHDVLAIVAGSAVNQDGASNGLTAPSGPAQQRVIRSALDSAGLSPGRVDLVEAHGTGTMLGDPIEANALLATYGQGREPERPLWLGSLKSNIGHTQAAAGVGGVMKLIMAMRHETMPASLHIEQPTPEVDWSSGAVRLLEESRPWPAPDGEPRRASVSSFGVSGTNAHVIIEAAPPPIGSAENTADRGCEIISGIEEGTGVWGISAKSDAALRRQADRLISAASDLDAADVGYSLSLRSQLEFRAMAFGRRDDLLQALERFSSGTEDPNIAVGRRVEGRTAFLFPGQGAQRPGMGRRLYETSSVFAETLDACDEASRTVIGESLVGVMFEHEDSSRLHETRFTQPALLAYEVALARLLQSVGIQPAYVVGHSIGEIAAAHIAGVLDLGDACTLVAHRGRLMQSMEPGAMMSIEATVAELEAALGDVDRVAIAAVNAPRSVVISGDARGVEAIAADLDARGRRVRRLQVSHAFHSPLMEPMLDDLASVIDGLTLRAPEVPVVSNFTGKLADRDHIRTTDYWVEHVGRPVLLSDSFVELAKRSTRTIVELGPEPTLSAIGPASLEGFDDVAFVAVQRSGRDPHSALLTAVARLWVRGVEVDAEALATLAGRGARVTLPPYPFEPTRHWSAVAAVGARAWGSRPGGSDPTGVTSDGSTSHALLGDIVDLADDGTTVFLGRVSPTLHPWLRDHEIEGVVLMPGTGFVEMARFAAQHLDLGSLRDLVLALPLVFGPDDEVEVQLVVRQPRQDLSGRPFEIYSRREQGDETFGEWVLHAEGQFDLEKQAPTGFLLGEWPPVGATPVDTADLYEQLEQRGCIYGPSFRGVSRAWRDDTSGEYLVEIEQPKTADSIGFGIHPGVFDACLHVAASGFEGGTAVPFSWTDVRFDETATPRLRAKLTPLDDGQLSLEVFSEAGWPVLSVAALATREIDLVQAEAGARQQLSMDWFQIATPEEQVDEGTMPVGWIGAPPPSAASVAVGPCWPDVRSFTSWLAEEESIELPPAIVLSLGDQTDLDRASQTTLEFLKAWLSDPRCDSSRLVVLTRCAAAVEGSEPVEATQSALWGMVRAAQAEYPGRLVLLDGEISDEPSTIVEACIDAGADQAAYRKGVLSSPRIVAARSGQRAPDVVPLPGWRLDASGDGTMTGLSLVPDRSAKRPLESGEVRVDVRAAGLNLRDVLMVLGMYPGEASVGSEMAGVVTEVGPGVASIAVGDAVMGLCAGGALSQRIVTDQRLLSPMPTGWDFATAASVPVVFLTAYYGLVDLGNLQPGERALIHSAAGGVGMAAVQLAHHLGATVFATASEPKWPAVLGLGVAETHLASSRTTEFRTSFSELAGGRGIEVVLNSLTGDFIDASLDLTGAGGRFLEMGKLDLREADELQAQRNIDYRPFDLLEAGYERIQTMLQQLLELFEAGEISPLPITAWRASEAADAFRHLGQAAHIGKNVIVLPPSLDAGGTVLITGGTGSLGGLTAEHLVTSYGVERLVLVSRRGPEAPGAAELRARLIDVGASAVDIVAGDVADRDVLTSVVAAIAPEHPLVGVVHTAGVLDDGVIESMTPERLAKVMGSKARSAALLDELTAEHDLAIFALFSSIAGVVGSPGQANYAAANAFLDGLAWNRRGRGLPATSIAWGRWERDTGMASGLDDRDLERIRRAGIGSLSDEEGLRYFDAALVGSPNVLAVELDHRALRAQPAAAVPFLLRGFAEQPAAAEMSGPSLAQRLQPLSAEERQGVVLQLVLGEIASSLGHPSSASIEPDRPLKDLGLDSLASVELRNRLTALTGLTVPSTAAFDYPTATRLAEFLCGQAVEDAGDQQLEQLRELLDALARTAPQSRSRVARQLRTLSASLEEGSQDTSSIDVDLASASADDLVRIVEQELGG